MDSLEKLQRISILQAHLDELWELIVAADDPIYRGIMLSRVSDLSIKIQVLKNSQLIHKSADPICNYLMGGASVQNLKRSWNERYEVLKKHFGFFNNLLNHVIILSRGLIFALKKQGKYW